MDVPSVEATLTELEDILEALSGEAVTLEESIALYARAAQLVAACNEGLAKAKVKIAEIDEQLEQLRMDDDI